VGENGSRPPEALTLREKASLLSGVNLWQTRAVEHAGIASLRFSDGPHGVRCQPTVDEFLGGGHSIPATCFPPSVALGSSWDPGLARRMGEAIGREADAAGVDVILGPGINIKRSPLCGRNFEYYSEDPHLSGVLGAAFVEGVQSTGVGASLKHFALNNQETDRHRVSADADERTMREIYLAAFEHVVKDARPWTVMSAYNKVNGVYASEHRWLLTTVLREEWGFDGAVVSDWGAVDNRVAALRAGLDIEMPTSGGITDGDVVAAVEAGALDESTVDDAVARIRALLARVAAARPAGPPHLDLHHALAREIAGQCVVLLKNDGALPLAPSARLAVVGALARSPRTQGAGSSQVVPTRLDDVLDEMARLHGAPVPFAPGYRIDDDVADPGLVAEAVQLAEGSEVTVVFLGLPGHQESEGFDRAHIDLPANQVELLRRLAATPARIVVVLSNGGVVRTAEWEDGADAVVEGWLLGQAFGGGMADVLFGVVNPSGRLAETIPRRLQDTASYLNFPGERGHVRYGEGIFVGYRFHDALDGAVSYPFGHGLSYTEFAYEDLRVDSRGTDEDLVVTVDVRVHNVGQRSGADIVQLYVGLPSSSLPQPPRTLRGFEKCVVEPGRSADVRFELHWRDFASFDSGRGRWTVEPGPVHIEIGASSRDIRLSTTFVPTLSPVTPELDADSTLAEWASSAAGRRVLEREMQPPVESGMSHSRFLADGTLETVGTIPLRRLARFPGAYLDPARLALCVEEVNDRGNGHDLPGQGAEKKPTN